MPCVTHLGTHYFNLYKSIYSLRIQGLLCLKLYKLKKSENVKFKKIIDDHNRVGEITLYKYCKKLIFNI